jgi:hypothetical protein
VLPTPTTLTFLSTVAYAVLTVAGTVLWKRTRSLRTALVAIGFALVLPDQVSALVEYFEFNALLHGHPGDTFFLIRHHAFLHYVSILGLWVAAVGLVWHAVGKSAPLASPNNRYERSRVVAVTLRNGHRNGLTGNRLKSESRVGLAPDSPMPGERRDV